MSKLLVKIISICALAILLPLTIVATALCVTEPVGVLLTISEGGVNGEYSKSTLAIKVDGQNVSGTTVRVKKHSEVTVVFNSKDDNGIDTYDFDGWYKGSSNEIDTEKDTAVSFDESFTFLIRGNTSLTAMRDVRTYNVSYTGFLDDGVTAVSTVIDETQQVLKYGETLESLNPVDGSTFGGWYQVSAQGESVDANGTRVAVFKNSEVELKPVWSNQMVVKYMKGENQIATARVSEENISTFKLLNGESDLVKSALSAGKEFDGWVDVDGNDVTSIVYDLNGITLYMKEKTITYTLGIMFNAISDSRIEMTYDIDNGFSAVAYETEDYRPFYTLKGYEFAGILYSKNGNDYVSTTGNKLSDMVVSGVVSGDMIAVWECDFDSFMATIDGGSYYNHATYGEGVWGVFGTKDGSDDVAVSEEDLSINFMDMADEDCFDLEDNIYEIFIAPYTNFHVKDGTAATFASKINLYVDGTNASFSYSFTGTSITFRQVLAFLDAEYGLENVEEGITITFMFDKAV